MLLDLDVFDAIEKLIRDYSHEEQGRGPSRTVLSERADRVFRAAHDVCEWRLGRRTVEAPGDGDVASTPIPLSEMLLCLKRIRLSIKRWTFFVSSSKVTLSALRTSKRPNKAQQVGYSLVKSTGTTGTSAQRMNALRTGYQSGNPASCKSL